MLWTHLSGHDLLEGVAEGGIRVHAGAETDDGDEAEGGAGERDDAVAGEGGLLLLGGDHRGGGPVAGILGGDERGTAHLDCSQSGSTGRSTTDEGVGRRPTNYGRLRKRCDDPWVRFVSEEEWCSYASRSCFYTKSFSTTVRFYAIVDFD